MRLGADAALRSICAYLSPSSKTVSLLCARSSRPTSLCVLFNETGCMSDGLALAFWTCKNRQLANILCHSRTSLFHNGALCSHDPKIIGRLVIRNLQKNGGVKVFLDRAPNIIVYCFFEMASVAILSYLVS